MAAYVIVDIEITNVARYEDYKELAAPTVTAYGGRYLVRGGVTETLEGDWNAGRVVVLEFPSAERAKAWWNSNEYAEAKEMRQAAAVTKMLLAEGR